jgi:hypothetical protein
MNSFSIEELITYSDDASAYNCFTSLYEADLYHGRRLNNDVWRNADEDTRTSALFNATDILHRQHWIGTPLSYSQALAFPRKWVPNRLSMNQGFTGAMIDQFDGDLRGDDTRFRYLAKDEIPKFLTDACAELANYLIVRAGSGKDEVSQFTDQLSSIGLGGGALNLSFREESGVMTDMPDQVLNIIRDFLEEITEYDSTAGAAATTVILNRS